VNRSLLVTGVILVSSLIALVAAPRAGVAQPADAGLLQFGQQLAA
jgi:hypothetical protein